MQTQRSQFQLASKRPTVERFDVSQLMDKTIPAGGNLVMGERIEHERVVRVGTMADTH
jgi:hypothetical protein